MPNSGWNAPLSDLATYLAFLNNSTRSDSAMQFRYDAVLKYSSLEEMWRPLYPVDSTKETAPDQSESIGLSFFILRRGQSTFIGHTGSQAGFLAFMYLNPANGKGVVAAFNTSGDLHEGDTTAFHIIREAALALIR
jgi:CubicO group peptidase (beta-lactamase class C family)